MTPSELRSWRIAHGLTQAQLAVLLGVGTTTAARWEQGIVPISRPVALALQTIAQQLEASQ